MFFQFSLLTLLSACSDFGVFTKPAEIIEINEEFEQSGANQVDVLWILDHTASMKSRRAEILAVISNFVDEVDSLNIEWQAGVISTDLNDVGALQGDPWIIHGDLDDPKSALLAGGSRLRRARCRGGDRLRLVGAR